MLDLEKLAAAREALGMEKEGGPILSRLAKKLGGGYAKQVATQAPGQAPGMLSKLKSLAMKAGLIGGGGAGLYALGKHNQSKATPPPVQEQAPEQEQGPVEAPAFSHGERNQFARYGLDPDRLKFLQSLSNLRQGMNLDRKMFQQALSGKLPPNVMGGGGDEEENLESYA